MRTLDFAPPQRVIAAEPVWTLARQLLEESRLQLDPVLRDALEGAAARLRAAVEAGATLSDLSTEEAAPLLRMKPESVATACRRGKIAGARKIAGTWRVPASTLGLVAA
jgi:DNA-directed RNA polymerase specialized sigma24 family protein